MFESEHAGGVEPRQQRYSSDWGSVSLSRGGSRAASPRRASAEQPGRGTHLKSHSSDDIGSSWMRTADSVNSGAHSVSSDWAEYDGERFAYLVPGSGLHWKCSCPGFKNVGHEGLSQSICFRRAGYAAPDVRETRKSVQQVCCKLSWGRLCMAPGFDFIFVVHLDMAFAQGRSGHRPERMTVAADSPA